MGETDLSIKMAVILSRELSDVECPRILDAVDVLIKELEMVPLDDHYNVAWTRYVTGYLK